MTAEDTPQARLYDARGNRYAVVAAASLRRVVPALPERMDEAARSRAAWSAAALAALQQGLSLHEIDGVVIGTGGQSRFEALILNTDGSLAERSGNGLTIYARALVDDGSTRNGETLQVRVHHDGPGASPLITGIETVAPDGAWIDLGEPSFGPAAVDAAAEPPVVVWDKTTAQAANLHRVTALAEIHPSWARSVFVRVGNPHCVTFLDDPADLPDEAFLRSHQHALQAIAFAPPQGLGTVARHGINLQWAAKAGPGRIALRIFERGEGWTRSSGSSATAVSCAARAIGLVTEDEVTLVMAGGEAAVRFGTEAGRLNVRYRGQATHTKSVVF